MSIVTVRVIAGDRCAAAGDVAAERRAGTGRAGGWRGWRAPPRCRCGRAGRVAAGARAGAGLGRSGEDAARRVSRSPRPASTRRRRPTTTRRTSQRAIFDSLYHYDYLARPYRLVPNTAAAMPEISADGRTWTIKVRPGIYFADDPAFKGSKRELTAHDYVYSWKRLLDPRMRAPFLWYLDGKLAGADAVLAKAKQDGRLDYDAPIAGLRAVDRYTLRHRAERARLRAAGLPVAAADGGGRARGDRGLRRRVRLGDGEPGRHRPVPAEGVAARPAIVLEANPELSASVTSPTTGEPADARADRAR